MLENLGFQVESVSSFEEGQAKIQKETYDLFFLDLNLPDGVGFDLIPFIKQHHEQAKVIIISAYDSSTETQKSQQLGVQAFVSKPFNKKRIQDLIASLN